MVGPGCSQWGSHGPVCGLDVSPGALGGLLSCSSLSLLSAPSPPPSELSDGPCGSRCSSLTSLLSLSLSFLNLVSSVLMADESCCIMVSWVGCWLMSSVSCTSSLSSSVNFVMSVIVWFSWGSWACSRPEGSFSPGGWSVAGSLRVGVMSVSGRLLVLSVSSSFSCWALCFIRRKSSSNCLRYDSPVLIYIDCYTDSVWVFYLFDLEFPTVTDPLFLYRGVVGTYSRVPC